MLEALGVCSIPNLSLGVGTRAQSTKGADEHRRSRRGWAVAWMQRGAVAGSGWGYGWKTKAVGRWGSLTKPATHWHCRSGSGDRHHRQFGRNPGGCHLLQQFEMVSCYFLVVCQCLVGYIIMRWFSHLIILYIYIHIIHAQNFLNRGKKNLPPHK